MTTTGPHLILGGNGFIGRHVALLLARRGESVVLCGRGERTIVFPQSVRDRIAWRHADLCSADWDRLIEGAGTIHHYAWPSIPATAEADPAEDLAASTLPTVRLLQAMRRRGARAPRLVFASSGGTVYGRLHGVPVHEDHPIAPITAYGAGKAASELYVELYRSAHGLDCRIARISNPFGAGQDLVRGQGAASVFLHRAMTNQPITIWGDGEVVRDYVHIADVAEGLVALASAPRDRGGAIFNLGSGQGTSLNGIVRELEARLGRSIEVRREPGRPFDVPVSILDIARARKVLGWSPLLSFSDGIARTLEDLERDSTFSTLHPHAKATPFLETPVRPETPSRIEYDRG